MSSTKEFHLLFAELAFGLSRSDGHVAPLEIITFQKLMKSEFGITDWTPSNTLHDRKRLNESYLNLIDQLAKNPGLATAELKHKYINVLRAVAQVFGGIEEMEEFIIDRFKKDLDRL